MRWKSSFVEVQGLKVHYTIEGTGPAVIMVHGLGASMVTWASNIAPLASYYRVCALNLPGHGDSDKPPDLAYDSIAGAHFLDHFMKAMEMERATLIGSSAGGLIAAQCALRYPQRVEKLILVDSGGLGRTIAWFLRLISLPILGELLETPSIRNNTNLMKSIFYEPSAMDDRVFQELLRVRNLPGAKKAVIKAIRASINLWGLRKHLLILHALKKLTTPLLSVWGEEDRIIPVAHAHNATLTLPNARVHIIPRCGHLPQMEKAPEFNQLVLDFLRDSKP